MDIGDVGEPLSVPHRTLIVYNLLEGLPAFIWAIIAYKLYW